MSRWYYRTRNGYEGCVWAATDDDAYNLVTRMAHQSPYLLRLSPPQNRRRAA